MTGEWKRTRETAFFAGANSKRGFISFYEQNFRAGVTRLYCIKGGPGTGKSRLLREVARAGEAAGYRSEYYYCSSDAGSLDGVILSGKNGRLGFLDATAPHLMEPQMPGASEELLNLGEFWNTERLIRYAGDIRELNRKKAEYYRGAYRYLSAAGEMSEQLRALIRPCLNEEKMLRTARRWLREIPDGKRGEEKTAPTDSIGMTGRVRLDTYWRQGKSILLLTDAYGSAALFLQVLREMSAGKRLERRVSCQPLEPEWADALWLEESGTVFLSGRSEDAPVIGAGRVFPMQRLLYRERLSPIREEVRQAERLRQTLLEQATEELAKTAKVHFALEELYTSAMDFSAKEEMTLALCRRCFGGT